MKARCWKAFTVGVVGVALLLGHGFVILAEATIADVERYAGSEVDFNIYWRGLNSAGLPVAPGVYRAVIYIDYASPSHVDTRPSTNVGISR